MDAVHVLLFLFVYTDRSFFTFFFGVEVALPAPTSQRGFTALTAKALSVLSVSAQVVQRWTYVCRSLWFMFFVCVLM